MEYSITSTVMDLPSKNNVVESAETSHTRRLVSQSHPPKLAHDLPSNTPADEVTVKVLLIDDQPMVAESIYRLLANAPDIEFYYCREVNQAIPMAVEIEPTVILQDLVMPDTNGLMLVKFFRANPATQRIPVIVLSNKDDSPTKAEAFSTGANDYLVKIPDSIELIARLRYHSVAYTNLIKSQAAEQTLADNKELERRVAERTAELETALENLKRTQGQLIQDEKMASLGHLIAGVAHEINNPVNFIAGNLRPAKNYANDLLHLIALYQQEYPEPPEVIQAEIDDLNLEFLAEDFIKLLTSLKIGTDRIHEIVLSLRNFSRADAVEMQRVDIHSGLDSTLLILGSKLKDIHVIKTYDQCPEVTCFPSQLNQVFMNILANAADALLETPDPDGTVPTVHIQTQLIAGHSERACVQITISDNGPGIPEDTRSKIFEAFFTTKPVGLGTGLGLSISHQIVTERHNGRLTCESTLSEGTSFVIQIPIAHQTVS